MPRNGSGTFSLAEPAFVSGNTISSTTVNTVLSDIATGLTDSLTANGQKAATANQPMGGNKHTGVGDATNRTDYAAAGQIADGELTWAGVAGGTADALTLSLNPVITAYVTGMKIRFQASASANTGATTVNVNSVGVKAVELNDAALTGGEIVASKYYEILYDGTAFQLSRVSGPAGITDVVDDTTPQLGGALDTNSNAINLSKGADVASASAPDIWGGDDGNLIHITGTTTITDFADAPAAGYERTLVFDGALTLTHGSGITLPGGANITTAAGDIAVVVADTTTAFSVVSYTKADGTAVVAASAGFTQATSQASTSGSSIDFTSIPAGTTQIIVGFDDVSINGTNNIRIQIGDSGGLETTGYDSSAALLSTSANNILTASDGFVIGGNSAGYVHNGSITLTKMDDSTNKWVAQGVLSAVSGGPILYPSGGTKALTGELDRLSVVSSDTFDNGNINITYI